MYICTQKNGKWLFKCAFVVHTPILAPFTTLKLITAMCQHDIIQKVALTKKKATDGYRYVCPETLQSFKCQHSPKITASQK